jgi:hypothetical protein
MVEYALTSSIAALRQFLLGLPQLIRDLDPIVVLGLVAVVLVLAFTLSSGTRH